MNFLRVVFFMVSLIFLSLSLLGQPDSNVGSIYSAVDGTIAGFNTGRYNNRPLYIHNTNAFVLAGDQPIARLAKEQFLYGTFMAGINRNGKTR